MASYQYYPIDTEIEAEYFNWVCFFCSICALSPMHLESQHMLEYGPFKDLNGEHWIKCDSCFTPFHCFCLGIQSRPQSEWFCPYCIQCTTEEF